MTTRLLRRPWIWCAALVPAAAAAAGLYWFKPWALVTDQRVNETLAAVPAPAPTTARSAPTETAGPAVVRQGDFISHEHATDGRARLIRNGDGSHVLELVGLDTSNGPDLRVWLSDQEVRSGVKGWHVFDDGEWLELGRLKGNKGDQAYVLPPGTDPGRFASVSIWCKRFSVSFGAAALES